MATEREVKIRVTDHAPLRGRLMAMGAERAGVEQEVNHILDTADERLRANSQLLRVRAAATDTLTWKGPAAGSDPYGHKSREELEVVLAAEGSATMLDILGRLGFHEVLHYDKQRETWHWEGATIALDSLDFGDFIEIEGDAETIQRAVPLLGLEGQPLERRSYPELQQLARQPS